MMINEEEEEEEDDRGGGAGEELDWSRPLVGFKTDGKRIWFP